MIVFDRVAVRYPGASSPAVDGVSFAAAAGVLTAVVGPNGSGKSTLVRALLRRPPPHRGRITIGGVDVAAVRRRELARRVAVVPQREELAFAFRVSDYVALGRFPHGGSAHRALPIARAVADAGIGGLLDRTTDELSGGEWQRVRIARALAQESPALVLDEPTTFLDIAHEMAVFELLDILAARGAAVVVVSHQLNLVARYARHVVLLGRGTVVAAGAPGDVMRAPVLEQVYEWPLVVTRDPAVGAPMLVPLRGRRS